MKNAVEKKEEEKKKSSAEAPNTRRRPFEIAIPYYQGPIDDDDDDGFFSPQFTRKERRAKFLDRRSKRMKLSLESMTLSRGADYLMCIGEQQDLPGAYVYSPIRAINLTQYMKNEILAKVVITRRYRDVVTNETGGV